MKLKPVRRLPRANARHANGVGLIEVMVAVLVMAIGMLGVAALQATALRNSHSSLQRGNAVIQSYAILDAMRANRAEMGAGKYDLSSLQCTAIATADTLAKKDINRWLASMKSMLVDSNLTCGRIDCDANNVCTVTVQWDDSRGKGGGTQQLTTVSRL